MKEKKLIRSARKSNRPVYFMYIERMYIIMNIVNW